MSTEPKEKTIDTAKIEKDARIAERKRFSAVMASEHHAGRETLASHLLSNTEMTAAEIETTLSVSPKVEPKPLAAEEGAGKSEAKGRNHFAEAMAKAGTPGVGAEDDPAEGGEPTPEMVSKSILSDYRHAGGRTVERAN